MGEIITEIFGTLWEIWKEMFSAFMEILPKAISFVLWILCGIILLPCVFIAGTYYPKWLEWGEGF